MSTAAAYKIPDIYGENYERFNTVIEHMLAETSIPPDLSKLGFQDFISAVSAKLERLAFVVRLGARADAIMDADLIDLLRKRCIEVDSLLLENPLMADIDPGQRAALNGIHSQLAMGICEIDLVSAPEIRQLSRKLANAAD